VLPIVIGVAFPGKCGDGCTGREILEFGYRGEGCTYQAYGGSLQVDVSIFQKHKNRKTVIYYTIITTLDCNLN